MLLFIISGGNDLPRPSLLCPSAGGARLALGGGGAGLLVAIHYLNSSKLLKIY
jgi:hypothetical protein